MESSNLYYKMQTMNQALESLVRDGTVTQEEALLHSDKKEDLTLKLSGMVGGTQAGIEAGELLEQASNSSAHAPRDGQEDKGEGEDAIVPGSSVSGIQMEASKPTRKPPGKRSA
jgi:hypothetical protein